VACLRSHPALAGATVRRVRVDHPEPLELVTASGFHADTEGFENIGYSLYYENGIDDEKFFSIGNDGEGQTRLCLPFVPWERSRPGHYEVRLHFLQEKCNAVKLVDISAGRIHRLRGLRTKCQSG
jgi:hypothetical protein